MNARGVRKGLSKVLQLSKPVGSETASLLESINPSSFEKPYLTQRKPLGRAD